MFALTSFFLVLGALLYGGLALWRATVEGFRPTPALLAAALVGMAIRCASGLFPGSVAQVFAEGISNVLWVAYIWMAVRKDVTGSPQRVTTLLPLILSLLTLARATCVLLSVGRGDGDPLLLASFALALAFCIGALVLLQSLYFASHRRASGFRLILIALAILWAYDLNLYAAVLLQLPLPASVAEGRGLLALALAPVLAVAARRKEQWQIAVSRTVALQSLSLVAIGGYFVLASTIASTRPWLRGAAVELGGAIALAAASAMAIILLASSGMRARVKVFVTKHLFAHRYDYRAEWLRFNATINSGSLTGLSPEERAIKALADVMEADGGLLLARAGHDRFACAATFEWRRRGFDAEEATLSPALLQAVETGSHIMIAPHYGGEGGPDEYPVGLRGDGDIWLVVPLVQMDAVIGLVALGRPKVPRQLDWEDFDLLKVLGQQTATYVADAHRQSELEEARQFEEFNRRFAFIVHDIKNVVSQLSLVAENAAEHGANPRFQADMTSTLRNAVGKMTTLLTRLSSGRAPAEAPPVPVDAADLVARIARERQGQHPVRVADSEPATILADPAALHTALDHLVQNAVEASAPDDPVLLSVRMRGDRGAVAVMDTGSGMSAEFIRTRLFKPFASTKAAGFGIGAGEARALIRQMGGELEVQSVEGVGTSFIVTLPLAGATGGIG